MKRNSLRTLGGVAILATLALAAGACTKTPEATPSAKPCGGKLAVFGAFSGANAGIASPARDGAILAVEKFNAANPNCKVTLVPFDTEGDPAKATPVASGIVKDASYIGVIGGMFSGESRATMKTFEAADMAMVSPSATATDLTSTGNKSFVRVVGNDDSQGPAIASYIKNIFKSTKVFVTDDGSAYGKALADTVKTKLGTTVVASDKVNEKQVDFTTLVSKVKAAGADAVFHGGYVREAAPFLKALNAGGWKGKFIGGDGLYDPAFATAAGQAASEGAVITCPCIPSEKAKGTFPADFQAKFNAAPGPYAAEGWDAANVLLDGILAGKNTRKDLNAFVHAYDKAGLTKTIKFDAKGEVAESNVIIWAYTIKDGKVVADQEIPKS